MSEGKSTISGSVVAGAWLLAAALAWLGLASTIGALAEGIDFALFPKLPLVASLLAIVAAVGATVVWARGLGADSAEPAKVGLGRRRFLTGGATIAGGLVGVTAATLARVSGWFTITVPNIVNTTAETTSPTPRSEWQGARVKAYRRLGRTGFEVSDISLGSGRIAGSAEGERIARDAIERGVNYFDTAPDYADFGSERVLGRALQGRRDKMFIATKFCTASGHLPTGSSVDDYVATIEGSLQRLQTDYVDLVHIHSCNTLDRLLDPNVHEAFDRLKQQGKARFLGFSSHTPDLPLVANAAIEDGRFDVMMLAYHHGAWPQLASIIERAAKSDVGVVAMKTLKGAKHEQLSDFRSEADSYTQAAFKWVLSNPHVACLVVSFFEPQHVDEYLHASGAQLGAADLAVLERYEQLIAGTYCEEHCGACLDSCPEGLPIGDVLRHRMYFEDYGNEKEAMRLYAQLDRPADVCASCSAPCTGQCPYGIAIPERMRGAHELLTLG